MKRRDLALLLSPLPLAPLMLALAACGTEPGRPGGGRGGSGSPFGFEMAMAGAAAATADAAEGRVSALEALTPEELAARVAAGHVRLIDVRTAEEVLEGAIPGAEHMPLGTFDPAALAEGDGREIVLYCRTGRRSAIAGEMLAAATGGSVAHLEGGILAWQAAGQPAAKPHTAEKPRN